MAIFFLFVTPQLYFYNRYPKWSYGIVLISGFCVSLSLVWLITLTGYFLKIPNIVFISLAWISIIWSIWYTFIHRKQHTQSDYWYFIIWIIGFIIVLPLFNTVDTIFSDWDALVSWNRWGLELYANKYHPIHAAYPILLPALYATIYKLQNTNEIWFMAKTILIIFPLLSFVYPLVLFKESKNKVFLFISLLIYPYYFMHNTMSGEADVPVMLMGMITLTTLFAAEIHLNNTQKFHQFLYALIVLSGLTFLTKQSGGAFFIFVLLYVVLRRKYIQFDRKFFFFYGVAFFFIISFWILYHLNAFIGTTGNLPLLIELSHYTFTHKLYMLKKFFIYPHTVPIEFQPIHKIFGQIWITPTLLSLSFIFFLFYKKARKNLVAWMSLIFLIIDFFLWGKYASYAERNSFWIRDFLILFVAINGNYFTQWWQTKKIPMSYIAILSFLVLLVASLFINDKHLYTMQKQQQDKLGSISKAKTWESLIKSASPCLKIYTNDFATLFNPYVKPFRDKLVRVEFSKRTLLQALNNSCSDGVYLDFRGSTKTYSVWKGDIQRLILDKYISHVKDLLYYVKPNFKISKEYFSNKTLLLHNIHLQKKAIFNKSQGTIDPMIDRGNYIYLHGWAFIDKQHNDAKVNKILLLQNEQNNKTYFIATAKRHRKDVAVHFKNPQLEWCGFYTRIYKEDFENGTYTLKILLEDAITGKQYLKTTSTSIIIKKGHNG